MDSITGNESLVEPSATQFAISTSEIREMAEELSAAATHPEFLKMIHEVQDADDQGKIATARANAQAVMVSARGVSLPQTFRVTTRTFEDPVDSDASAQANGDTPIVAFNGSRGYVSFKGSTIMVMDSGPESESAIAEEIKSGLEEIGRLVYVGAFSESAEPSREGVTKRAPGFRSAESCRTDRGRGKWDLAVPNDMHLQRSEFADGRPTLFCVTKILPLAHPWHKVTITFDDAVVDSLEHN